MINFVKIKSGNAVNFEMMGRKVNALASESLKAGIIFWRTHYMAGHFEMSAYQKYKYDKRQVRTKKGRSGYSMRKQRVKHHNRPLVWSGESERQLRNNIMEIRTFATKAAARGILKAPRHFFIRRPLNLNKADELTRQTPEETQTVVECIDHEFSENLQRENDKSTTVKII